MLEKIEDKCYVYSEDNMGDSRLEILIITDIHSGE